MAIEKGRMQYVNFKKETTRLTAETTAGTDIPFLEWGVKPVIDTFQDMSGRASLGKLVNEEITHARAEGPFKGVLDADYLTWALYHVFGSATPVTADGATTWSFALLEALEVPTFTSQYSRGAEGNRKSRGTAVKNLTIEIGESESTYSGELVAAEELAGDLTKSGRYSSIDSTTEFKTILSKNFTSKFASTLAGLGAGTEFNFKKATISIERETEALIENSLNPLEVLSDGLAINVSIDLNLRSDQFLAPFMNGELLAFELNGVATNKPVIGTSAEKPALLFQSPPSQIKAETPTEIDSIITQTISFDVRMPELAVMQLVNATATW